MQFQTRLAVDTVTCAFAHESALLPGEIMHRAVLPSQLLKFLQWLGLCQAFLTCFQGQGLVPFACLWETALQLCFCEGAFDLLNCTVQDVLVG